MRDSLLGWDKELAYLREMKEKPAGREGKEQPAEIQRVGKCMRQRPQHKVPMPCYLSCPSQTKALERDPPSVAREGR